MATSELDIDNVVEAWNRCNISTAQLALLQDRLGITVATLHALGERGLLVGGLYQMLNRINEMQEERFRTRT